MVSLKSNFQVILQPTGGVFCKHISIMPFGFVSYSATPGFYSKIMQNNIITSTASPIGAGIVALNARKASPRKKAVYFVDLIGFAKGNVEVDYTINNDNGHSAVISLSDLTEFLNNGFDSGNTAKRRVQGPGSSFRASYLLENIYEIVESYLIQIRAGQTITINDISQMNIGELSKIINNSKDKSIVAECEKQRQLISDSYFAKIDKRLFKAYGWVPKKSDW